MPTLPGVCMLSRRLGRLQIQIVVMALSGPKAGAECHALQMVKDYADLGLAQEVLMRCVWVQTVDESQMYKQQMAGGMGNPMGPPDPKKAFEAEKSQLEMVRTHRSVHDTCTCVVCA